MTRYLLIKLFFSALFLTISASAETKLEQTLDLSEGAASSYSPYSYKANCSYLYDAGCSGSYYNPATGSTSYAGFRSTGDGDGDSYRHGRNGHGNRWNKRVKNGLRKGGEGRGEHRRRARTR